MNLKHTVLALAALACSSAVQADIVTYTGNTSGAPTFNRPIEDLSALSVVGTATGYNTFSFTVSAAGTYSFLTTAAFDSFTFLYSPGFNPAAPLLNVLKGNDDLLGLTTSGFQVDLAAGTTYVYLTTGFANDDLGRFSTTIGGKAGDITATPAIPEPASRALLAAGLLALVAAGRRRAGR